MHRLILLLLLLSVTTALLPPALAADVTVLHQEPAAGWHFESAPSGGGSVDFGAFGRSWRLELAPNGRLAMALEHGVAGENGVTLYRGRVAGEGDSWLRLTRDAGGSWTGLVWDGRELYGLESAGAVAGPAGLPGSAGSAPVLFRLADVRLEPGALGCAVSAGAEPATTSAKAGFDTLVRELAKTVESEIDVAILGDADFAARHADPVAALAARLNNIDGIFSEQVGVTLNVTDFRVFSATDDPLTGSTDPSTLLSDLGNYKSAQADLRNLGLVHLYTGRDLDDRTAGIAYTNALCNSRFGAGLSEGRRTVTTDSLIGAHEIGHNFGAPHDGETDSACESTPETFLMAARLNGSSTFSACSLEQMAPRIASASCLQDLPDADMTVSVATSQDTVLEGDTFDLRLTATNLGTVTAELVSISVDLPSGVRLEDGGTLCTAAAGGAECSMGTVSAGSSATAELVLAAVSPGTGTATVEVRAESDNQPSNNIAGTSIRVDPAADLAIVLQGPAELVSGARATLNLTASNASPRTATDVAVRVVTPSFLTPVAAQSAAADCTIAAAEIRCEAATLTAGDSLAIALTLDAVREGTGTVSAEVSAAEGDPDASDNAASRSIVVSSASAATSSGGGGHGLWLLLLAAGACRARRLS